MKFRLIACFSAAVLCLSSAAYSQDPPPGPINSPKNPSLTSEEPAATAQPKYIRHGFTMEIGLGIALTSVSSEDTSVDRPMSVGLAPLSLSLGGFLSPNVALMGRMA